MSWGTVVGYRFPLWRDKWLLSTLAAFFFVHSSAIRVVLRAALEGPAFSWGHVSGLTTQGTMAMSRGVGLHGHTDHVLGGAFVVMWLLCMGLRRPDRFFQSGILVWNSIALGVALWLTMTVGDALRVEKQTLGISMSHVWASVFPLSIAWALSLVYAVRNWRRTETAPARWTVRNTRLLASAGMLLVLTALLLHLGPQHGTLDRAGIGTLYAALLTLLAGLAPWERRRPSIEQRAAAAT